MMSAIKNMFRTIIGERSITSFDFLDFAHGKAIQIWYGLKTRAVYTMIEHPLYSDDIETMVVMGVPGGNQKIIDVDFDIVFDKPQIIDGTILVNTTHGCQNSIYGSSSTCETYLIAKIRKWDGTTETDLASKQSATVTVVAGAATSPHDDKISALEFDIARTKFKKGDTLRLTIEQWALTTGASAGTQYEIGFGHDPKNRDSPSRIIDLGKDTSLTVAVPFRIDI